MMPSHSVGGFHITLHGTLGVFFQLFGSEPIRPKLFILRRLLSEASNSDGVKHEETANYFHKINCGCLDDF